MKLGAARARAPTAWRLVDIEMDKESAMFIYALNRQKLRRIRRREGRYLLRTNLTENDPALLWQYYTQLVAVEEAFKDLKGDLAIRPVFHQDEQQGRSSYLHCVPGLLPADHVAAPPACPGAWADRAECSREVRGRSDDRRSSADHRRTRAAADSLHPAGAGTPAPDPAAQAQFAAAATTADRLRAPSQPPRVVQTFPTNPLIGNGRETENTPIRDDGLIAALRWCDFHRERGQRTSTIHHPKSLRSAPHEFPSPARPGRGPSARRRRKDRGRHHHPRHGQGKADGGRGHRRRPGCPQRSRASSCRSTSRPATAFCSASGRAPRSSSTAKSC